MIKTMNHQKEIEERISLNKLTNNEECKSVSTVSTFMPKLKRYCALFQPICERKIQQTIDDSVDEIDGLYGDAKERKRQVIPLVMIVFSVLQLIVYLRDIVYLHNLDPNDPQYITTSKRGPWEINLSYNPFKRYEAWRFLTYMFVHKGLYHILMNLVFQLVVGIPLEYIYGWWRVTFVYVAGVIANVIGTSIIYPEKHIFGSSGGVYALIGAYLIIILLNWKEMEMAIFQFMAILIFTIVDVLNSFNNYRSDPEGSVGYMGHLCGTIAGLLVGILILRYEKCKGWQAIFWWCSFGVYVVAMISGVSVHIFCTSHFGTGPKYSAS